MKFTAAKPYSLSLNNQGLPTTIIFFLFDFLKIISYWDYHCVAKISGWAIRPNSRDNPHISGWQWPACSAGWCVHGLSLRFFGYQVCHYEYCHRVQH